MNLYNFTSRSLIAVLILFALSCSKKDDVENDKPKPKEESIIKVHTGSNATTLDLGSVFPNHRPIMRGFRIYNSGTKALNISSIELPEGCTFFKPFEPFALESQDGLEIFIHFLPTEEKTYSGKITVHSDADKGDSSLPTIGKGITKTYDYDGNEYNIVKIGSQLWLKENFRGTHYLNGDLISNYAEFSDPQDDLTYGKFYQGFSLCIYNSSSERLIRRGSLVEGFSLPSNRDWEQLFAFLGGTDVAGGKLKQSGTSLWKSPNTGASNQSGFTALPAGQAAGSGVNNLKEAAYFWSYKFDSPEITDYAYHVTLFYNSDKALFTKGYNGSYYSLRLKSS